MSFVNEVPWIHKLNWCVLGKKLLAGSKTEQIISLKVESKYVLLRCVYYSDASVIQMSASWILSVLNNDAHINTIPTRQCSWAFSGLTLLLLKRSDVDWSRDTWPWGWPYGRVFDDPGNREWGHNSPHSRGGRSNSDSGSLLVAWNKIKGLNKCRAPWHRQGGRGVGGKWGSCP
jgi:hypothetical protein